jgi:hypothetical protein
MARKTFIVRTYTASGKALDRWRKGFEGFGPVLSRQREAQMLPL